MNMKVLSTILISSIVISSLLFSEENKPDNHKNSPDASTESSEEASILTRGPFVHFIDERSVRIFWETNRPVPSILEYGLTDQTQRIEDQIPTTQHSLTVTGLQSDSDYTFAILSGSGSSESIGGTFRFDSTYDSGLGDFPSIESPYPNDSLTDFYANAAEQIVRQSGVNQGICLVYGFNEGRLAYEIAKRTRLRIIGIEEDETKIAFARTHLRQVGVYGDRISVQQGSFANLPYGNYFANLIVSDRILLEGKPFGSASEIGRVLRPCGGVLYLGQPQNAPNPLDRRSLEDWLTNGGITGFSVEVNEGSWISKIRDPLPDAGEWTHQYAEPGNSACSGDQRIQDPMEVLWFGRPGPRLIINRHSRPMAPLYKNGRIFIPGDDRIITLDAYNGTRLWDLGVPGSRRMGAFKGSAQMALSDESIYIAQRNQCHAIDVMTGLPTKSFSIPLSSQDASLEEDQSEWGYISCMADQLFGTAHPQGAAFYAYSANGNCDELEGDGRACMISDSIFSFDRDSGDLLWKYQVGKILETSIAIGGDRVYFAENRNLPPPQGEWERPGRRWVKNFNAGENTFLVALDRKTGNKVWEQVVHLPFTEMMYLSYSDQVVITVGTYNLAEKCHYALFAYDATSGQALWSDDYDSGKGPDGSHGEQWQHPVIMAGTIFSRPFFYQLHTGIRQEFTLNSGGKCGTYSASSNYLFARDSNPSYYPYGALHPKSRPLSKITRPGCFINIIPVGGLVLLPESSSGCTCEYSVQTSMAFIAE